MPSSVLGSGGTVVKATEKDTALTEEALRERDRHKPAPAGSQRGSCQEVTRMHLRQWNSGGGQPSRASICVRRSQPWGTQPEGCSRRRAATAEAPRQAEATRQRWGPRLAHQYHTVLHVVIRNNVQSGRGRREAGGPGHRGSRALGGVWSCQTGVWTHRGRFQSAFQMTGDYCREWTAWRHAQGRETCQDARAAVWPVLCCLISKTRRRASTCC